MESNLRQWIEERVFHDDEIDFMAFRDYETELEHTDKPLDAIFRESLRSGKDAYL